MNDDELVEMMHHIHVLNKTENKEVITFDEFYEIITKKNYWVKLFIIIKVIYLMILLSKINYVKYHNFKKNITKLPIIANLIINLFNLTFKKYL